MHEMPRPAENSVEHAQDKQIEAVRQFLESYPSSQHDKILAQYKLFLRHISGNQDFQGSGIEEDDAHHLANSSETGFLQLGKLHLKGDVNEGTLNFFDRYGWMAMTTKFTDLILVFAPGTQQVSELQENMDQLPADTVEKIQAMTGEIGVRGIRPAHHILFVVYNPNEKTVSREVEQVKQRFPDLANKFFTIQEFTDKLSPRGMLPGEKPMTPEIDMARLVSDLFSLPISEYVIYEFLANTLFPMLNESEKVSVLAKILTDSQIIRSWEFFDHTEHLPLIQRFADQLSEKDILEVMKKVHGGHTPEYGFLLIYCKYTLPGRPLPPELRRIVTLADEEELLREFASTKDESDWNALAQKTTAALGEFPMFEYFFHVTKDRSHQDRIKIAAARADFEIASRLVELATLRREILMQEELPRWKQIWNAVRKRLSGEKTIAFARQKSASEAFYAKAEIGMTTEYDVKSDLSELRESLGNNWTLDVDRPPRKIFIEPNEKKRQLITKLIPTVVPDLAAQLQQLLKTYDSLAA